jgi:hypothetical protein
MRFKRRVLSSRRRGSHAFHCLLMLLFQLVGLQALMITRQFCRDALGHHDRRHVRRGRWNAGDVSHSCPKRSRRTDPAAMAQGWDFRATPAADIRSLFQASAGVVPCKIIYGLEIVLFGIACCSSKHDCNFSRFTGTRACAPFGAARKYCTGQETDCSSSCAARNGQ